jgi:dolichyl-phosphate-mannose-protein mannosyltransferase
MNHSALGALHAVDAEEKSASKVLLPWQRLSLTFALLFIGSFGLFLAGNNQSNLPVFDEQIYIDGAKSILSRGVILNPEHPPLGKLMIAAGMGLAGDNPLGWRLAGMLCGAVIVAMMFLWTYLLLKDHALALTAALLTLFNNFIFVMSRNASLDVPMFMFTLSGVTAFTAVLQCRLNLGVRRLLLLLSGAAFGLAAACKWTALVLFCSTWLVVLVLLAWHTFLPRKMSAELSVPAKNLRDSGLFFLLFGLIAMPLTFYTLAFIPVLRFSHTPFSLASVARVQVAMWTLSKQVVGNRAIFSPWYRWPFQTAPVRAYSYLLGNPAVMWTGVLALGVCIARLWKRISLPEALVVLFYSTSFLQWVIVPRKITFYYYYFPAAMFLSVAIVTALSRGRLARFRGVRVSFIVLMAAVVIFVYCYPQMAHLSPPWDCMLGCWS